MTTENVSIATCDSRYDSVKGDVQDTKTDLQRLWDRYELLSQRAPKWCVMMISVLSGLLGSAVTLICVLVRAVLA